WRHHTSVDLMRDAQPDQCRKLAHNSASVTLCCQGHGRHEQRVRLRCRQHHSRQPIMDYPTLELLSQQHPAWQLLRADHAPLVISFLEHAFITPNVRTLPEADLVEALEDQLYAVREQKGERAFPRGARDYLNDW